MSARKLGKGLDSLLSNTHAKESNVGGGPLWVPAGNLRPNSQQPRQHQERGLESLAGSIRKHGILQPIVVTALGGDDYEILAGERRWRAAQLAGLKSVPVIVREGVRSEAERLELALIENVQREDLDPIERAKACARLVGEFGLSHEEVAAGLGYERPTISNLVRLLELPEAIQAAVSRGTITAGHARALLRLAGSVTQGVVFKQVTDGDLSVRKTEELCSRASKGNLAPRHKPRPRQAAWVSDLQERVTRACGLRSEIRLRRGGGGRLVFHFQDLDQLDRFVTKFGSEEEVRELIES